MTDEPLRGYTVGITAERRREEFASALERRGARVLSGPAVHVLPLVDDTELEAATRACLTAPLDVVVLTTGVGYRGWVDAAAEWGLGAALHAALESATLLTRGPKVRGAARASGLRESWSPESESSAEVLQHLLSEVELAGKRIAVQLHGEPHPGMLEALVGAGAEVLEVPVYRWVLPSDLGPLRHLQMSVVEGQVDALAFTSAPAAQGFLQVADADGLGHDVRRALRDSVVVFAVGPVTAAPLVAAGLPVLQPDRARLGALVRDIAVRLPELRPRASA